MNPQENWRRMINWSNVLPPSRPSLEQLNIIRKEIKDVPRELPVGVLGSTVEFRNLLMEEGFSQIYILENNLKFYESLKKYTVLDCTETIIEGDWLATLEECTEKFALLLSDLTSGNIEYSNLERLYCLIQNSLIPDGLFIDKVLTYSSNFLRLNDLLENYKTRPLNLLWVNRFSCEFLFCSELIQKDLIVNSTKFYELILEASSNPRIHKFVELCELVTPRGCIWYYGKSWAEIKGDYCPSLKKISAYDDFSSSPYFNRAKIFCLKRLGDE